MSQATEQLVHMPAKRLKDLLVRVRREAKTGSLTLHFSRGFPSGTMQWKEKGLDKNHEGVKL